MTTVPTTMHSDGLSEEEIGLILRVHGHLCPMVLLGARVAKRAMLTNAEQGSLGGDKRLFGFFRGFGCAVDGIQLFTGCTWGNGNLVLLRGRNSSLILTEEGKGTGIEVSPLPGALDRIRGERSPEARSVLMDRFTSAPDSELLESKVVTGLGTVSRYPGA
ncbi:MAG: FmdE family protein [bacterium]|nr:FmdE family protein [bacterium]MDT8396615.1 FmdE family protein [bacterium]